MTIYVIYIFLNKMNNHLALMWSLCPVSSTTDTTDSGTPSAFFSFSLFSPLYRVEYRTEYVRTKNITVCIPKAGRQKLVSVNVVFFYNLHKHL